MTELAFGGLELTNNYSEHFQGDAAKIQGGMNT